MSFYDRIPGYWEAVAAESAARDAAFLDLPQTVCGVAVRPLTLRDYLRLSHARSPFVRGGRADRGDIAYLLWHQSFPVGGLPAQEPPEFARQFDGQDLGPLCAGVGAFIDAALSDRSSGSGTGSASPYSLAASFIHTFRLAYPTATKDEILDTPLDQLWQLERCIRRERNPRELFSNPRSDRVKGEYARQYQEGLRAKLASESRCEGSARAVVSARQNLAEDANQAKKGKRNGQEDRAQKRPNKHRRTPVGPSAIRTTTGGL